MPDFKHCDFFLLRYVPDVVKQEFVNVGVVMLEEGEGGFTDVRFTRDWRRVRCLEPEVDIELLLLRRRAAPPAAIARGRGHQLQTADVAPPVAARRDAAIVFRRAATGAYAGRTDRIA